MIVYIDEDERYPDFSIHEEAAGGRTRADLSPDEIRYIRAVCAAYDQVQRSLRHLYASGESRPFSPTPMGSPSRSDT
jgi:hypothetical protein